MKAGSRVELKPHLDRWMMGDRFGEVLSKESLVDDYGVVLVLLDKSGDKIFFKAEDLKEVR